jgi:C1A family cysteine protease
MFTLPIPRNPKYGWIPDLPDQRDLPYATLAMAIPQLPTAVDLRARCTPVENQGVLGSCTACALVGNLEFIKKIKLNTTINFSKLFLYYNERVIRHSQKSDSGASIRDGIKSLVNVGDCLESFWPYNVDKFAIKPPLKAYRNALNLEITKYYRLHTTSEMKHTLSTGYPFVFGFAVYESFEAPEVAKTGLVPMPKKDERVVGGHAVMAVGYDNTKNFFIVRNSWGTSWGDKGYFYMPYGYLTNLTLSSDFWTIRAME